MTTCASFLPRLLAPTAACAIVLAAMCTQPVGARELSAGPHNYREVVRELRAGDTLSLEPGTYRRGLDIHGLIGTAEAPIVIQGAGGSARTRFVATGERNTVRIVDAGYVTVRNLHLEGASLPVDAVKAERTARFAHHITLEGLRITGYGASQQTVAISTKCPSWDWTIRGNVIVGAGTGLYLGDSDGTSPFVRGTIERNVIVGTVGYNVQIKHQRGRPSLLGMPSGESETVVRYNAFGKDARSSAGPNARPNVLIGHLPLAGPGSRDRYLVYGNVFVDNPGEFLLQAEGNVVLYNNLFLNRCGGAVAIREHHDLPREVSVFHNTIVARDEGVVLRHGDFRFAQRLWGNAVFAARPVVADIAQDNVVGDVAQAGRYLNAPFAPLPDVDLRPRSGMLRTRALAEDAHDLPDAMLDVDGTPRTASTAGAYAGSAERDPRIFASIARLSRTRGGPERSDPLVCGQREPSASTSK